ncbi:methyltransferase domain-containing protein [Colletotrichum incanum]|uniref:Methyltransferase domain-containing protein n=1 Tax=Colletotrichum incanum TaxID=1573173 RepID=A0A161WC18_COLIC|nr:methyltransferase domain-containing protein [Colletotrichum incanum]
MLSGLPQSDFTQESHLTALRPSQDPIKPVISGWQANEDVKDALDLFQHLARLARGRQDCSTLRDYDLGPNSQVLDYGTGTGIWARQIAESLDRRRGQVFGFDAACLQPQKSCLPKNLYILLGDENDAWRQARQYDVVHTRAVFDDSRYWPKFYRDAYHHLKPGGLLEIEAVQWILQSDDGTLPNDSALRHWAGILYGSKDGKQYLDFENTKSQLEAVGFIASEEIIKLPVSAWDSGASDEEKEIGDWFNSFLNSVLHTRCFSLYDWGSQDTKLGLEGLMAQAREEIRHRQLHTYFRFFVWTAKKPMHSTGGGRPWQL